MSTGLPSTATFGPAEAKALLERLRKDGDSTSAPETCRLYFLDVDVLSTYINGANGDILSAWSSLFSLTSRIAREDRELVDSGAHDLADALARSISGFLMGRFRETRSYQSARLWLTVEHGRELDSMIGAVIDGEAEKAGKWQEALYNQYISLSAESDRSQQDASTRLQEIFETLRTRASAGKVPRSYDVKRRFTATLTQAPVFPPPDLGRAFLLRCDTPQFERSCRNIGQIVLNALLARIRRGPPAYQDAIEFVLRQAFDLHGRDVRLPDQVKAAQDSEKLHALIPSTASDAAAWIRQSARIAAVRVSDVFAVARLVAMSELLQEQHALRAPYAWRICLISGSPTLTDLLSTIQGDGLGLGVEVLHPLSVMRFDEFLRPLSEGDMEGAPGDEYALAFLGDSGKALDSLDHRRFFSSLQSLLGKASAGYAYQHDRSLLTIERLLRGDPVTHSRIVRVVGNAVSSDFITTLTQVNKLAHPPRNTLPAISLPWVNLALPNVVENPADRLIHLLHSGGEGSGSARLNDEFDFAGILRFDPTGYSACVCASLGYLSMEPKYLLSAEVAANTAVRTSIIASEPGIDYGYVPEGNEALYLSAFISRLRVSGKVEHRRAALEWRDNHAKVMQRASERAYEWAKRYPALAGSAKDSPGFSAIDLIRLRYDVEGLARAVWCKLIDSLEPRVFDGNEFKRMWDKDDNRLLDEARYCVTQFKRLRGAVDKDRAGSHAGFVGSQLAAALLQLWISAKSDLSKSSEQIRLTNELQLLVSQAVGLATARGSVLLQWLNAIFEKHDTSAIAERVRHVSRPSVFREFAAIDDARAPFLARLYALPKGSSFAEALPRAIAPA